MTKTNRYALPTAKGVLALVFLGVGGMKLALPMSAMAALPLPALFLKFIGACEVLGAAGLVLPGILKKRQELTLLAAIGLSVIMLGAIVSTLAIGGGAGAFLPLAVGLLLGYVIRHTAAAEIGSFRVQRSATIEGPASAIVPYLVDLRQWARWSPFEQLDGAMKRSYGGASHGRGSVYAWDGNRKAGAGRAEITDVSDSRIAIRLDFLRPFEAHHKADFTLASNGGSTTVTWTMSGATTGLCAAMGLLFDMDKMIGKEFEKGLASLKAAVEEQPEPAAA